MRFVNFGVKGAWTWVGLGGSAQIAFSGEMNGKSQGTLTLLQDIEGARFLAREIVAVVVEGLIGFFVERPRQC